ncbi:RTA1 like protein-domain-containing protein [Peziza echinospora]|nr:RTA1 like protein-domain-containing protein [Peziza echinospora]
MPGNSTDLASGNGELPKYQLYKYAPSLAAAILFTILFLVTTIFHTFQMIKFRSWYWIPFVVGGYFQVVGYAARSVSSQHTSTLGPYLIQTLLVLLAPAVYAASIYMVLGRIIASLDGERYSFIRRTWLTKIFVGGDVLSFLTQSAGGGLLGSADGDIDKMHLGENLVIIGLFIQIIFFGVFVIVAIVFHFRYSKSGRYFPAMHKRLFTFLYGCSILILIRSIFRTVEYLQGEKGYFLSREVFLYIFETFLMFIVMAAFNFCHPGEVLGNGKHVVSEATSMTDGGERANYGPDGYMLDSTGRGTPSTAGGRY